MEIRFNAVSNWLIVKVYVKKNEVFLSANLKEKVRLASR